MRFARVREKKKRVHTRRHHHHPDVCLVKNPFFSLGSQHNSHKNHLSVKWGCLDPLLRHYVVSHSRLRFAFNEPPSVIWMERYLKADEFLSAILQHKLQAFYHRFSLRVWKRERKVEDEKVKIISSQSQSFSSVTWIPFIHSLCECKGNRNDKGNSEMKIHFPKVSTFSIKKH